MKTRILQNNLFLDEEEENLGGKLNCGKKEWLLAEKRESYVIETVR